jgi:hypothetical protein
MAVQTWSISGAIRSSAFVCSVNDLRYLHSYYYYCCYYYYYDDDAKSNVRLRCGAGGYAPNVLQPT